MKFFINNLKLLLNYKVVLIIACCFIVNIFYSGENFSTVIYGVRGSFNLNTAIPWLATVFPFFLATGAFISQSEDNKIFVLSRIKNWCGYYICLIGTLVFFTFIYCTFYGVLSFVAGEVFLKIAISVILLFFNLLFLATVQWLAYLLIKNTMVSIIIPLTIIICALVFYRNSFNMGSWSMFIRSSVNISEGFNMLFAIIFETFLTITLSVFVFLSKNFKEIL